MLACLVSAISNDTDDVKKRRALPIKERKTSSLRFLFSFLFEIDIMASESSVTEPKTAPIENQTSVEATIKGSTTTTSSQGGAADSTCNDDNNGETSDPRKSLDFAVELSEKGTNALKENDFSEAVECFSRALEIRLGSSFHFIV